LQVSSRFGFRLNAPEYGQIRTSAVVEFDFFGDATPTTKQGENYNAGPARMRQFYAKMETPVIDVLAGLPAPGARTPGSQRGQKARLR